jgi:hypothetical protein
MLIGVNQWFCVKLNQTYNASYAQKLYHMLNLGFVEALI